MIKTQYPFIDGLGNEQAHLIKHFSDENKIIKQIETGTLYYCDAIDVYPCRFTYLETEESAGGRFGD